MDIEDNTSNKPQQQSSPRSLSPGDEITQKKKAAILKDMIDAPVSIAEINNLKKLTNTREIEIAGGDLEEHVRSLETTEEGQKRDHYYHDLLFALIQVRLPEDVAEKDWNEILRHKYTMSKTLGRNVGIHVATLDYYTNIKKFLENPKIVEADEYANTAHDAISDELTEAYNRRFFDGELIRLFKYCDAYDKTFSLIMLDMDYFKNYNDVNGHIKGDIALIETVRIFHTIAGSQARVCRYGGEEFTILLSGQPLNEAFEIAENIRQAVFEYRFVNEQALPNSRLSISGGVAEFNKALTKPEHLLENADKALYLAKRNGRNRIERYTPEPQE